MPLPGRDAGSDRTTSSGKKKVRKKKPVKKPGTSSGGGGGPQGTGRITPPKVKPKAGPPTPKPKPRRPASRTERARAQQRQYVSQGKAVEKVANRQRAERVARAQEKQYVTLGRAVEREARRQTGRGVIPRVAGEQLKRELEGRGVVAGVLRKAADVQSKPIVSAKPGDSALRRGIAEGLGQKGLNTRGGLATAVAPTVKIPNASEGGKRVVEDVVNFPAQAVASVYVPAAAVVEAVQGRPQRLRKLAKDVEETDPLYNVAAAGAKAIKGDSKAAKEHLGRALKSAAEHPGYTALEAYGAKGVTGRTASRSLRAGGAVEEKVGKATGVKHLEKSGATARKIATTRRPSRRLEGTNIEERRTYSPDLFEKGVQVAMEKRGRKKVRKLREQADRVEKQDPDRANELRAKARRAAPDRVSESYVRRRVDERVAANEDIRRVNRAEVAKQTDLILSGGQRLAKRLARIGGTRRSERPIISLVAQRIVEPDREDLKAFLADVQEAAKGLSNKAERQTNQRLQNYIQAFLDDDKADFSRVAVAAEKYAGLVRPLQKELTEAGLLGEGQGEKAALIPAAVRRIGAYSDDTPRLTPTGVRKFITKHERERADKALERAEKKAAKADKSYRAALAAARVSAAKRKSTPELRAAERERAAATAELARLRRKRDVGTDRQVARKLVRVDRRARQQEREFLRSDELYVRLEKELGKANRAKRKAREEVRVLEGAGADARSARAELEDASQVSRELASDLRNRATELLAQPLKTPEGELGPKARVLRAQRSRPAAQATKTKPRDKIVAAQARLAEAERRVGVEERRISGVELEGKPPVRRKVVIPADRARRAARVAEEKVSKQIARLERQLEGTDSAHPAYKIVAAKLEPLYDEIAEHRAAQIRVGDDPVVRQVPARGQKPTVSPTDRLLRAIGRRAEAREGMNAARVAAELAKAAHVAAKKAGKGKPDKRAPGLVDEHGRPLSAEVIQAEIGGFEPAFVTQAPNERGARNYNIRPERMPTIRDRRRTGEATRRGTFDIHEDTLREGAARARGLVDAVNGYTGWVDEFALRDPDSGDVLGFHERAAAEKVVSDLNARGDRDWRLIRLAPFGARSEQLTRLFEETAADHIFERMTGDDSPLVTALREGLDAQTGGGPFAIVPDVAANQLHAHIGTMGQGTAGKLFQLYNSAFRKAVLATNPAWFVGNVSEATLRAALAKAGPTSWFIGRRVTKQLRELDPEAAKAMSVRALGGGHYSFIERAHVRRGSETFAGTNKAIEATAQALGKFWRTPGPKHLADIWHSYTQVVFHELNGRLIERQFQTAMLGRAIRESELMDGHTLKLSKAAVDDAARGLTNTNNQVAFGRAVDRMYGRYGKLKPNERLIVAYYTPFLAWAINAAYFVTRTLPQDHPTATAVIASMEMATEDWRKDHGLDQFAVKRLPLFLQGAVPIGMGDEKLRIARFTPFGAFTDPGGTFSGQVLPQLRGVLYALNGMDWKGDPLKSGDGGPATVTEQALEAAHALFGSSVPFLGQGERVADQGIAALNPFKPVEGDRAKPKGLKISKPGAGTGRRAIRKRSDRDVFGRPRSGGSGSSSGDRDVFGRSRSGSSSGGGDTDVFGRPR